MPEIKQSESARCKSESQLEKAAILFALILFAVSVIRDGVGFYANIHALLISTAVLAGLFTALHLALNRCSFSQGAGSESLTIFLYNLICGTALSSLAFMATRKTHFNLLVLSGLWVIVSSTLLKRGTLSTRRKLILDAVVLCLTGLYFRVLQVVHVPLETRSDMLVLVSKALECFVDGASPYRMHKLTEVVGRTYTLPLTYLPGQWLSYAPPYLLGVDLRYGNIFVQVVIFICFIYLILRAPGLQARDRLLMTTFPVTLFLNGYSVFRIDSEIPVYSLLVVIVFACLRFNRPITGLAVTGLALATTPLALLTIPFLVFYCGHTYGYRKTIMGVAWAGLFLAIIVAPFILKAPDAFKAGLWDHWRGLENYTYAWAKQWISNINFVLPFYRRGSQDILVYIQVAVCFLLFLSYMCRKGYRSLQATLSFCAVTLFAFLLFNIVVWTYLFQPVWILTVCAALSGIPPGVRIGRIGI